MTTDPLFDPTPPEPWRDDARLPWHDPGFSARMLREHLAQTHDRASRRLAIIDEHVAWLHEQIVHERPSRILDLACGPGLYTERLARLGHTCTGIDIAPASIRHARSVAARDDLACTYVRRDLRDGDYGTGFDVAMLTFGEFNTFPPAEAASILVKIRHALQPGAPLILEAHTEAAVLALAEQPRAWGRATAGLFGETPHCWLRESFWHDEPRVAIERYLVMRPGRAVDEYRCTTQSYSSSAYDAMLDGVGFAERRTTDWPGSDDDYVVMVCGNGG